MIAKIFSLCRIINKMFAIMHIYSGTHTALKMYYFIYIVIQLCLNKTLEL